MFLKIQQPPLYLLAEYKIAVSLMLYGRVNHNFNYKVNIWKDEPGIFHLTLTKISRVYILIELLNSFADKENISSMACHT